MFTRDRGSRPWRGRGLGLGWILAFGLGYALRDLQEPDSQVRKLFDAVKDRFAEMKGECPCCETKKGEEEGEPEGD